ncbi:MAG: ClpXP protease specificity-enhancing factor SspB [Alphaproteobacteria bacterium]
MRYLDYEQMVDKALLGVVRGALDQVAKKGLKDDHHFYITFLTQYPGVELAPHLIAQYPDEITVVLQYEFWNLEVLEDSFSVDINFGDQTETIKVPFKSVVHISDPSSNFELEFNPEIGQIKPFPQGTPPKDKKPSSDKKMGEVISLDQFRKK